MKIFVGDLFSVSMILGIEKFYAWEGFVTIFCRNFFCLTLPKKFVGEPYTVALNSGVEKYNV